MSIFAHFLNSDFNCLAEMKYVGPSGPPFLFDDGLEVVLQTHVALNNEASLKKRFTMQLLPVRGDKRDGNRRFLIYQVDTKTRVFALACTIPV